MNKEEQMLELLNSDPKLNECLDFIFQSEPCASWLGSYCRAHGISDLKMFQVMVVMLEKSKIEMMTKQWVDAEKLNELSNSEKYVSNA